MTNSKNQNIWKYAVENTAKNSRFTTDGGSYKFLKVIYFIVLAYTFAVNLLVILGQMMNIERYSSLAQPTTAQTASILDSKNLIVLAVGSIILLISGVFLLSKKKAIAFLSVNVFPSVALLVSLRLSMEASISSDGPLKFWVRHGIPLTAIIVFSCFLFLICFFENYKRKCEYNRLMNGLYTYFSEKDENIVRNSDFEEYLNTYDGFEVKGIINKPLKRSEKIRKRKQSIEEDKVVEIDKE